MNEEEDDRFGCIHEQCRISASQELYLQNCPFARESELFPEEEDNENYTQWMSIHSQIERIIMVSPPESPKDDDVFQTPPEGSIANSSQEKETAVATADSMPSGKIEGGDGHIGSMVENDDKCAEAVNLGSDSDNLGFSSVRLNQVSKPMEIETRIIKEKANTEEEEEEEVPLRKRSRNLRIEDPPFTRNNGEGTSRRKLPASIDRKINVNGRKKSENEIFKALFIQAVQKISADDSSTSQDVGDFLEIAQKQGMVFPKPRWWPPEGFHE